MPFSIILFSVSWLVFIIFSNKRKFFIFSPTCYAAIILGLATDLLIYNYPLWSYPAKTSFQNLIRVYLDDLGVYFVVTYLFLQTLPKRQTIITVGFHIFLWTIPSIALEGIALFTEAMKHGLWWSIYYSYLSNWILFASFYLHHRLRTKYAYLE
ncbi:MAG: hypothetical protein MJA82_07320 [Clostridia bacterium]|nr:hypothetical protein [Clostridia bacterium]